MAFPWLFLEQFELGTRGAFDSTTDTNSKLSIRHFSDLARYGLAPYSGAYALHIDLSGGTADAYIQEDTDFDTALGVTIWVKFCIYVSRDITMAASDRFTVFTLQSGAGTDEAVVDIRNSAGDIQILAAETGASATVRASSLTLGRWHQVELGCVIDSGAPNDGTISFYVDGIQIGTTITGLDQGTITQARLGTIGIDAGTTAGHVVIDNMQADDLRIFAETERFPLERIMTASGHVFVGPGYIDSATLLTTGASNTMYLWDTDAAFVSNAQDRRVELDLAAHTSVNGPISFQRGCYVQLNGTNPRGQVTLVSSSADQAKGAFGPIYYSNAGYINYGLRRRARVNNQ